MVMRGGPKFVSCQFCFRPVLEHSLSFHETKCGEIKDLENANSTVPKIKTPPIINDAITVRKLSPKKPVSSGLTKSASASGPLKPATQVPVKTDKNLLTFNVDGPRPGTMTLRGRSSSLDTGQSSKITGQLETLAPANMRVCFVCGQRFGRNSLEVHEKKCLHFWHCVVSKLPNFVKYHEPKKLQYHSVDGTVDYDRVDLMAQQTSMQAQRVECGRCRKSVQLSEAKEHVASCKPKPKNTKKKNPFERDFYVTMF